jgi:hypothetical protein
MTTQRIPNSPAPCTGVDFVIYQGIPLWRSDSHRIKNYQHSVHVCTQTGEDLCSIGTKLGQTETLHQLSMVLDASPISENRRELC